MRESTADLWGKWDWDREMRGQAGQGDAIPPESRRPTSRVVTDEGPVPPGPSFSFAFLPALTEDDDAR